MRDLEASSKEARAFLVVQSGEPYERGSSIPLPPRTLLVGRSWRQHRPDISFSSRYVSRDHAQIDYTGRQFAWIDLPDNKHGTEIGGKPLVKGMPYVLRDGDTISMAKGAAVVQFFYESEVGETMDFAIFVVDGVGRSEHAELPPLGLVVDEERRTVLVEGREVEPLVTGREFELLCLLYHNLGRAVSRDTVKSWVWRDRAPDSSGGTPEVGDEEINSLVYRLRQRLGEHGRHLVTIPRYGIRLDLRR